MPVQKDINQKILETLDKILMVLAIQVAGNKSVTESACLLKLVGLDNQTIAKVLNTTRNTISVLTANLGKFKRTRFRS